MFRRFFISAGDYSGNLIGASLIEQLQERYPEALFEGVGGREMEAVGFSSWSTINRTAVTGVTSVLRNIFYFRSLLKKSLDRLKEHHYDCVILIDFPGFNMRLLKYCRAHGIPVYYVAPPQVWAWKKERVHAFKGVQVQTVFEFENSMYAEAGATVHFCGHPVYDRIDAFDPSMERNYIALLPGSRKADVLRNFQSFIFAARTLQSELDFSPQIVVVVPKFLSEDAELKERVRGFKLTSEFNTVIAQSAFAVAVPGSNNMELLAAEVPAIIMYQAGWLNYLIARALLSIRYISAVNILAEKEIFPELVFCRKAKVKKFVSFAVKKVLSDEDSLRRELAALAQTMGASGFTQLAADNIGEIVNG